MNDIVVANIDENRCKTNTGKFTLILGVQIVSVYSYIEPTTNYCIYTVLPVKSDNDVMFCLQSYRRIGLIHK